MVYISLCLKCNMGNFCICKNSQSFPQVVVSIFNFRFMGLVMVTSYDVMVVELQRNYGDLFLFAMEGEVMVAM